MRKFDPLLWFAYLWYGAWVVAGLGFAVYLLYGMYVTLWFGQETYDCVKALC
jgi:hypothetical protein